MNETLQGHVFQVDGNHGLGLLVFFFFEIFDALQPVLQADAQVRELAHPDGVLPLHILQILLIRDLRIDKAVLRLQILRLGCVT